MILQIPKFFTTQDLSFKTKLLSSSFKSESLNFIPILVTLYEEGMILQWADAKYSLVFDFDVKFTFIRQKVTPNKIGELGQPRGFKFERIPDEGQFSICSDHVETLMEWRNQLRKLINQRGFHELYKPFRKIGKGNTATVYLAQRMEDKQKVAVKAFAKQTLINENKGKPSLINEIKIMRKFDHPALMKLEQVFETDNSYYLALEHLSGGQLYEHIISRRFTSKQIQLVLKKLTEGLTQVHKHSIIHRDLKPENLIFRSSNKELCDIVIADFGLATITDQPEYLFIRCGTPGYVAPEIISFKQKTGQETISDVFALGIITHILATGRSPFPGREYKEVLNQNKNPTFNFDLEIYKNVNLKLLDLIQKMVKVDPKQRIKTQQILSHQFLTSDLIDQIVSQQQIVSAFPAPPKKNDGKYEKIHDTNGSFTVPNQQILKGTDDSYVSINSVDSSRSQDSSPVSIKQSAFVKREREGDVVESQFKAQKRQSIRQPRHNIDLNKLRSGKKEETVTEGSKVEEGKQKIVK